MSKLHLTLAFFTGLGADSSSAFFLLRADLGAEAELCTCVGWEACAASFAFLALAAWGTDGKLCGSAGSWDKRELLLLYICEMHVQVESHMYTKYYGV